MFSFVTRARTLAGLALTCGLLALCPAAANAEFVGTFGTPYRPFNGVVTFRAEGGPVNVSRTINVRPMIDGAWARDKAKFAAQMRAEIGKARRFRGQTAYNVNVVLGGSGELQASADGPRLAIKYIVRGNSVTAKMTTPSIFGSYADPKFTADFDIEIVFHVGRLSNGKLGVTSTVATATNVRLRGRNVTGTVGLAIADVVRFVGGPDLRRLMQNAVNGMSLRPSINVGLAPVAAPGDMFSSMSGAGVLVRLISGGPGPIVR